MRNPAAQTAIFFVLAAAAATTAASCGARTPLSGGVDESASAEVDGGRDADGGGDEVVPCKPGRFALELAAAQLMFVIDRSGSMSFTLDGAPARFAPSRWEVLHGSLSKTIVSFDAQIAMGAKFFPETAGDDRDVEAACRTDQGVALPPARGNAKAILDVFDRSEPVGGTPTAEAVRFAAQYLAGRRTVARTMVLATDGAPNCNGALDRRTCTCTSTSGGCASSTDGAYDCLDDVRAVSAIRDIFDNQKIPVYVIGIGGSESPAYLRALNEMAVAGGRPRPVSPRYYDARTEADLTSALTSIRDTVAGCTYLTPSAPTDPDAISVEIDGQPVARDPSHTDGWDWVDQAYGELAFFGASCTAAATGAAQVSGVVACTE